MADQAVLVEQAAAGVDVLGRGAVVDAGDPDLAAFLALDRPAGGAQGVDEDPAFGFDRLPGGPAADDAEGAAPAGHDGDVLGAAALEGDRRRDDAAAGVALPELLAVVGAVGGQLAEGRALEDEVARGGQRAARPRHRVLGAPDLALGDRIPGQQVAREQGRRRVLGQ